MISRPCPKRCRQKFISQCENPQAHFDHHWTDGTTTMFQHCYGIREDATHPRESYEETLPDGMQRTVMQISMTFDPVVLLQWARMQKGVCCDEPAHDINTDWMDADLQAQFILAHALLSAVPIDTVVVAAHAISVDNGISEAKSQRITEEYQASMEAAGIIIQCETCHTRRADMGEVEDPYRAEVNNEHVKEWFCTPCYESAGGDI